MLKFDASQQKDVRQIYMAKRHQVGPDLLSQVRRCQELIMARTGVDEFYETIRLFLAKRLAESSQNDTFLDFDKAQSTLATNKDIVKRFVEGGELLTIPAEVANECLKILSPTTLGRTAYDVLHTVFEQMTGKHYKADKGQYFTPPHVVDFCISVLRPRDGELICDPACGSGAFLKSAFDKNSNSDIYGFDISKRASNTAALLSYLACEDSILIQQSDSLLISEFSSSINDNQTIESILNKKNQSFVGFDVIATNPPFAGDVSDAPYLKYYETSTEGQVKAERDTLFLERCLKLLKPNGRMAIVLPDNKFSGSKFLTLRKWILTNCKVIAVVSLHSYTFRPFTSQKACVLFIQKTIDSVTNYPISFYRSDKPGKSSTGEMVYLNEVIDHDLEDIAKSILKEWKLG